MVLDFLLFVALYFLDVTSYLHFCTYVFTFLSCVIFILLVQGPTIIIIVIIITIIVIIVIAIVIKKQQQNLDTNLNSKIDQGKYVI